MMNQERCNIIMLASAHSPFDTRIFHKEAKSLVKNGYRVSIIVPHNTDEEKNQVKILGVKKPRNGFEKLFITPFKVLKRALKQDENSFFHVHDSELLYIAIILKLRGRKVIYDAHEDTPLQIMYQHWIPRWLRKTVAKYYYILENVAGKIFDAIVVAEPVIKKYYPPEKTVLIRNFPLTDKFTTLPLPWSERKDALVYIGLLSKPRGIDEMARAAGIAKKKVNFNFIVGGKFAPVSLQEDYLKNNDVTFLSWLSLDELVSVLKESKIGIIIPNPIERYLTNYPVKMFEYMAAGLPVIASKAGVSAEFIEECKGGILVDPLNPEEIAEAIEWLLKNSGEAEKMGQRGRELVLLKYNWEVESQKLITLYKKLNSKGREKSLPLNNSNSSLT